MENYKPTNTSAGETTTDFNAPQKFRSTKPETEGGTSDSTPLPKEFSKFGRTWPDLIHPFINNFINKLKGNVFIIIPTIIYIVAITSGHLKEFKEFLYVTLAIMVLMTIIFLNNKSKI